MDLVADLEGMGGWGRVMMVCNGQGGLAWGVSGSWEHLEHCNLARVQDSRSDR